MCFILYVQGCGCSESCHVTFTETRQIVQHWCSHRRHWGCALF